MTHQTGAIGKEVKRLYVEEASDILKELYLSCLIDRETSKIAFISSTEGGMDIEKVASESPQKIITTKLELKKEIDDISVKQILKPFNLNNSQFEQAKKIIIALFKIIIEKDASLIEINPLIITKDNKIICLDAKMNFDDNALYRRPDVQSLRGFKRGRSHRNKS